MNYFLMDDEEIHEPGVPCQRIPSDSEIGTFGLLSPHTLTSLKSQGQSFVIKLIELLRDSESKREIQFK